MESGSIILNINWKSFELHKQGNMNKEVYSWEAVLFEDGL
jgi:hypothetical protein